MPSPRAVLADLTAQGLKLDRPHSNIGATGHIKVVQAEEAPAAPVVENEKKPEPKSGLVHLHCDDCLKGDACGCECKVCAAPAKTAKKAKKDA